MSWRSCRWGSQVIIGTRRRNLKAYYPLRSPVIWSSLPLWLSLHTCPLRPSVRLRIVQQSDYFLQVSINRTRYKATSSEAGDSIVALRCSQSTHSLERLNHALPRFGKCLILLLYSTACSSFYAHYLTCLTRLQGFLAMIPVNTGAQTMYRGTKQTEWAYRNCIREYQRMTTPCSLFNRGEDEITNQDSKSQFWQIRLVFIAIKR